jgi:hypothetical protein
VLPQIWAIPPPGFVPFASAHEPHRATLAPGIPTAPPALRELHERTPRAPDLSRAMTFYGNPQQDDGATRNLKPEDETQRAKQGTKIGHSPKRDVLADFRKIVHGKRA